MPSDADTQSNNNSISTTTPPSNRSPGGPASGSTPKISRTVKWKESQDERKKQQLLTKLQVVLFRHKELLVKDMKKKRTLLEKELQIEIQVNVITHYKFYLSMKFINII